MESYRPPPPGSARRRFLKLALGLGGVVAVGALAARIGLQRERSAGEIPDPGEGVDELDALNSNIVSGGPGKDGIPSIDRPRFISVSEADDFLEPEDIVFGIDLHGEVRAYPQRILVWHEISNDSLDGRRVTVTYCPLTGSQIAFKGRSADASDLTFGTTGKLVNSNLLMYDRQTDSDWPQILATAINGSRRGERLSQVPLVWTTWARWRDRHPDTVVLSSDTGYIRNYNSDPYGSYDRGARGYYSSSRVWFPTMRSSERFPPKKVFLGIRVEDRRLAVPFEEFRTVGVDNTDLGGVPIGLFYDGQLDAVRAYRRNIEGQTLNFVQQGSRIVDEETESVWSPEGVAVDGPFAESALQQVDSFNVMWFAWYAFFPDTLVYG